MFECRKVSKCFKLFNLFLHKLLSLVSVHWVTQISFTYNTINNTQSVHSPIKDSRANVLSMSDRLELTRKNITFGSRVKFMREGKTIHDGVVVGLTDTFVQIYKMKPKNGPSDSGDVSPETAQWFPMVCREGGTILI